MAPPSKNNGDKTARTNLTAALNDVKNEFNRFHKGLTPAINTLANFQGTLNSTMVRNNTAVDLLTQAISKIKPDSVDSPTPTPTPKPDTGKPEDPKTPTPKPGKTPAGEDSPAAPQSGQKEPGIGRKMLNAYSQNFMAIGLLTTVIGKAMAVQREISTAIVSTGNIQAVAANRVSDTFDMRGLALGEAMQVLSAASLKGLDLSNRSTNKMLGRFTLLGKNMSGMADIVAMNTQVLGMSQTWSSDLGDRLIELGHNFGLNTDTLVSALNQMSQTLIRSAAAYGKETSKAVMDATTNLIASYGDASKDMITSISNKLFEGTAASEKLAATLGVDISKLASSDPKVLEQVILDASRAFNDLRGGEAGGFGSGTILTAIENAIGAGDIGAAMIALDELVAQGPTGGLSAEEIEQASLQADIMKNVNESITKMTALLIPLMGKVAEVLSKVLPPIFTALTLMLKPLALIATTLLTVLAVTKIGWAFEKIRFAWDKIVWGKDVMFNLGKLTAAMTTAAGVSAITLGIAAVVGVAAAIALGTQIYGDTAEDGLEESKKQTSIMLGENDKGHKMLMNIASAINRSSIYQEQQVILAEEAQEMRITQAEKPPAPAPPTDNTYSPSF